MTKDEFDSALRDVANGSGLSNVDIADVFGDLRDEYGGLAEDDEVLDEADARQEDE